MRGWTIEKARRAVARYLGDPSEVNADSIYFALGWAVFELEKSQARVRELADELKETRRRKDFLLDELRKSDSREVALKARVRELEEERRWKPIETAPKDGTTVALLSPWIERNTMTEHLEQCVGSWDEGEGCWVSDYSDPGEPTYWYPIPPPPSVGGSRQGEDRSEDSTGDNFGIVAMPTTEGLVGGEE